MIKVEDILLGALPPTLPNQEKPLNRYTDHWTSPRVPNCPVQAVQAYSILTHLHLAGGGGQATEAPHVQRFAVGAGGGVVSAPESPGDGGYDESRGTREAPIVLVT